MKIEVIGGYGGESEHCRMTCLLINDRIALDAGSLSRELPIERQVAIVNPQRAGFHIHVLLAVALTEHTDNNRQSFERHVALLPEVMECFSVSGERDYVLDVVVRDMAAYNTFLNSAILKHPAVRSASSTFALRRVKYTTRLPLETRARQA